MLFLRQRWWDLIIIIIIAPAKLISASEIRLIKEFVNKGGTLLLTSGYSERGCIKYLLGEFDLDILNIPLGPYQGCF
jgi:hypothetical protein